jgi:beta-glucosidase
MRRLISILISSLVTMLSMAQGPSQNSLPQLGKSPVSDIVNAMSLEEKAKLVVGMGFRMPGGRARRDTSNARRDTARNTNLPNLPAGNPDAEKQPEKVAGSSGRTFAIARLGIPSVTVADGPAGVRISPYRNGDSSRSYFATAWPVATLLASTWDTALVQGVGRAFGNEIHEYGVDIILGPGMNIHRNPLGGRNFEYYSEDPLVSGHISAAIVKGIQSQGVGTSIKHFAANNQETNRNSINTIISERALREIYLKGFEIVVKTAHPWTIMSSYNKINGIYTSEDPELLTNILRKEWGYKGLVMTDWFGGKDPVAQMQAGNDLLMPGTVQQTKAIIDAVNAGKLDPKILDQNVTRVLNLIILSPAFAKYKYSDKPDLAAHARISREAATEGMVLLKNQERTLPMRSGKAVAIFGNTAYDPIAGGTGSGDVNKAHNISLAEGMLGASLKVDEAIMKAYSQYISDAKARRPRPANMFMLPPPIPEMSLSGLDHAVSDNEYAIICIGRNAGEGRDRAVENDFTLSDTEKTLIKNVSSAFHAKGKKVIVVLNIGGVIEVASWRDMVDAILLAWQPGQEGGYAIADILSGRVNPSGKLATTFPMEYQDVPSAKNFPGKVIGNDTSKSTSPFAGKPAEVVYEDGIYVGYRYYASFHIKTAYEFGHGLSYTQFSYSPITLSGTQLNGKLVARITVTNTGKVAGKEIVQWYIKAPAKKMDKPAEELKGFAKTALLQPGKSQTITFTIEAPELASFDTKSSSWVAEAGNYELLAGASSTNIKQKTAFQLSKDITTEKDSPQMVPKVDIRELTKESSTFIYELNNFGIISR